MNPQDYEAKIVKILDAQVKDELGGGEDNPKSIMVLHLLLQDINDNFIFPSILQEEDVRKIIGVKTQLSSGELIKLSILLRQREEPLKLLVPKSSTEINVNDILQSRNLDQNKNRNRNRNKNRNRNRNRKINNINNRKDN